ncbi:PPOX class F420-dependent oxidoreductase [Actinokineospora terrae]|uniref:Pyridoxamine 5'-phosphate oxidase n=1 Tax=Actinokineospora terrae TaxID=155974 RepID=A0A1H9XPP8_9PSEU|nr:PPOX class F420-dependent oxidoreductase [Actinokineospora terrae]SES47989.1 Pyridoxamine 5'-phosphate oxidase [Actinokineospora terrae]
MPEPIPESHHDILEAKGLAFLATTRDHRPNVSPTWYLWDATQGHLLISLTDKRQKYRNLVRDPHVAACLILPDNQLRYIELRGHIEFTPDTNHDVVDAIARKYLDQDTYPHNPTEGTRVVAHLIPDYVRCFR